MAKWKAPYHGASEDFLRLHLNTDKSDCIAWPYALNNKGYGLAVVSGKQRGAHNWMCRLAHGEPVSIWKHAAHSCNNPICVNPNHLRWATHAENMADMAKADRQARGSRNGQTKLTEQDVLDIRNAPADLYSLAAKYGVSRHTLSKIRSGVRWKHVGGPLSSKERNSSPTCRAGHVFNEKNTYWTRDGYRNCRACGAAKARRRRGAEHGVEWSEPGEEE